MKDIGLLIIRVGLGISMIVHGYPKLFNPERWEWLGSQMVHVGVHFGFSAFGMMAGVAEVVGGLFLMVGLFFRPSNVVLAFTMFIALMYHVNQNDGYNSSSHALELMIVFIGLSFIGPGRYAINKRS